MLFESKRRRRRRLAKAGLSGEQSAVVSRNLPVSELLSDADRRELESAMGVFLAEKSFEGCGGLELTDEIRTTVAAHGCLLLLRRDTDFYSRLDSILVYPTTFVAPVRHAIGDAEIEDEEERLGESSADGAIVIAWEEVLEDLAAPDAGCSVLIHEFAHQLDEEYPDGEGAPLLASASMYAEWARTFSEAFEAHVEDVDVGRPTLIDEYGAESPAEFFAVCVECFFLLSVEMSLRHPALYGRLSEYFSQDPASW
jgi:Mlc titration factor MtfA (ptsG expression regulator)